MKKRKKKSKRQTKKQNLKSCCLFYCEKKVQRRERKAEETSRKSLLSKINILSLRGNEHTKQKEQSSFQPKRQKKNHRYLAIKLTHVDTLYSLKHSHTHNVLCYPIRCCAIRSLERRFQEKRQSSVSRGGVVLVLRMFFVRIVLF